MKMSAQPPASGNQSVYDEKHRKIILKESLVGVPESSIETVNSPQDDSWTQHSWQKAGSAYTPQQSGKGKNWRNRSQVKQPNRLQKKLEVALAKPVQITKAESMMQKMGWQGGALGKTGNGIVEPVAPNAAYAIKTRGFGQASHDPDPPQSKKKKMAPQKPKKKDWKTFFHTNVLHQILAFVKNDYESEIVFDKQLFKNERKQIHHLVNEVIMDDNDVGSLDSLALMDLVQEIRAHNYYILCTQSRGTFPDRYLCIFKEAPKDVYLITPKDLREQSDDADDTNEITEENSSNNQNNVNKDLNISNERVKENDANVDENVLKEQLDSSKSLIIESDSIDEIVNKEFVVTSSVCEVVKQNSDLENGNKDIINEISNTDQDNSNELKNNNKDGNTEAKNSNKLGDSPKEIINKTENVKEGLKITNESKSRDSEGDQNIDITETLIEYFKEFAESEDYSEIRFLGSFTKEEMDHINKLVSNVYYHVNHNEDKVEEMYKEVFKGLDEERYVFEVKEDINWSPVIHKTDTYEGKRKSTEGHIFFDTEELL